MRVHLPGLAAAEKMVYLALGAVLGRSRVLVQGTFIVRMRGVRTERVHSTVDQVPYASAICKVSDSCH